LFRREKLRRLRELPPTPQRNGAQGAVELPEELIWLWRNYDSAQTRQEFEQDTDERAKPSFRFTLVNRDADQ
jgi:hypothetical protein